MKFFRKFECIYSKRFHLLKKLVNNSSNCSYIFFKKQYLQGLVIFAFLCFAIAVQTFAAEDVIELKIISSNNDLVEAKIVNFNQEAIEAGFDEISLIGKVQIDQDSVNNIDWNDLELKEAKSHLKSPFKSKIIPDSRIEKGDSFSAKGNYDDLISAIKDLIYDSNQIKQDNPSSDSKNNSYSGI